MKSLLIRSALLLLIGAGLTACSSGGGGGGIVTPPPGPTAKFEDQFGANFGAAYRGDPNTEPKDITAADVITPSLTAEPVMLPGT